MSRPQLQEQFIEFVTELERQKIAARDDRYVRYGSDESKEDGAPNSIWEQLATLLRKQARRVEGAGPAAEREQAEAQYAMVALADETFLRIEGQWSGRSSWESHPLEQGLYETRIAESEIFRRIERVLAKRDPNQRDLARVYFGVLTLGFEGRFASSDRRGARPSAEVENLRERLFTFFDDRRTRDSVSIDRVSSRAYDSIETRELGSKLPGAFDSVILLVAVLVCVGVASFVSYEFLMGGLRDSIDSLEARTSTSTGAPR
ncbi:MAG: DotU family type IV/VI secretion system protein [Planctomycetota bacterium]